MCQQRLPDGSLTTAHRPPIDRPSTTHRGPCGRQGAFTLEDARAVLGAGRALGLTVRAHAEQIEPTGCARLVAELGGARWGKKGAARRGRNKGGPTAPCSGSG
jgi:hypothetical protein